MMGITAFIAAWGTKIVEATGYVGLFFLMAAESMILPIPAEAVMPFAGFLVAEKSMSAPAAVGFATLGSLFGSLLSYALGRFGGRALIARFGKAVLLDQNDLDAADRFFHRRGAITIFVGRFIPVVRHLISIPAGMGRMRLVPFCLYTVLGAGVWNGILIGCGIVLRRHWDTILRYAKWADAVVLLLLVGVMAVVLLRYVRRRRSG